MNQEGKIEILPQRHKKHILVVPGCGLGLVIIVFLICSNGWRLFNQAVLRKDVNDLLHHQVKIKLSACEMIPNSRSGYCLSQSEPDVVDRLVETLNLAEVNGESPLEVLALFRAWDAENGCRTKSAFSGLSEIQVLISDRRPAELKLGNGSAFEYLVLYYIPSSRMLCIQVSYAYS